MRSLLILCGVALLHIAIVRSQWSPASFPNPQRDPAKCGRSDVQRSWVCDPDGLLSKQSKDVVEGTLRSIELAEHPYAQAKTCGGRRVNAGYQVAVAATRSIAMPWGADEGKAAEHFAADLINDWGVGDAACNDGALLLLCLEPRQVAIYAGPGAKEQLTAGKIKQIIARMRPMLRDQKYGNALEGAVVDIGIALSGGSTPCGDKGGPSVGSILSMLFFGIVFIFIIVSIIASCGRNSSAGRRTSSAQSLLEKITREQAQALRDHQYPVESCPICLEDFGPAPLDSRPSAPPLDDNKGTKGASREASRSGSAADLKAKLLGAQGQSSSSDRPEGSEASRKSLVLPCGHSFCENCLARWIGSNATCPICRASLTNSNQMPAPAACLPQQQQQQRGGVVQGWRRQVPDHMIEEELLFRLSSVRRMYPQVVTDDIMTNWEHQVRRHELLNWPAMRAEQLSPQTRQQHEDTGTWGAVSSFGGGHSSGGGGASGSW